MPVRALGLVSVVCALIGLITVGSTAAFYAIISLGAIALYISYLVPLTLFTLCKLEGRQLNYGPWRLGRFGLPINIFAICYCIFVIVWLPFPSMVPVTAKNFNYAGPIMGAVIIIAIVDYLISGKKRFRLPVDPTVD
jgi:choline transport protein